MPAGQWAKGFGEFFLDVQDNAKVLMETDYMKNRMKKSHDRDLRAIASKDFGKELSGVRNYRDRLMVLTRMGDAGAIIAGGWPVYNHFKKQAIKEGKTPSEAHAIGVKEFTRATDRAQQSAEIMSLGYWQSGGSLAKMFTMFQTSPIQYNRILVNAIKAHNKGRINKKQLMKTALIYHVILPQIFTAMGSLGIGAFSEDDERRETFWRRQLTALVVGNFNSVFLLGDAYEATVKHFTEDANFRDSVTSPVLNELNELVGGIGEALDGDLVGGGDQILSSVLSAGGLPYDPIRRSIENYVQVAEGDSEYPIMRLLGYSDYALMERISE